MRTLVADHCGERLLVVGEEIALPIATAVDDPKAVGTDRLCTAAAAYDRLKQACVVADFGTAITVDLVDDSGVFRGGTILPGVSLSAEALHEHTALLPSVAIEAPNSVVGANTVDAIRSGVFHGVLGAIREITERYAGVLNKWPTLVFSGGDAEMIGKACDFVDRIVPDLCLWGIALADRRELGERVEAAAAEQ